jgi:DNA-binding beta-propeller fold protein YncE
LTHVISDDQDGSAVVGVTSLDNWLFVLRKPSRQSIQVYDLKTFTLLQTLKVTGLSDHLYNGLTACVISKRLYVGDHRYNNVYRLPLTGNDNIFKWSVGRGPSGLSINNANNLLVACYDDGKIQEYNKISGSLVREICLQSNNGKSLCPIHVIQLTNGQFVIGGRLKPRRTGFFFSYTPYDVVQVDDNGRVVVSYRNQLQSTRKQNFSLPRHLVVDKNNECYLVADTDNNRIVILNRSLTCAREFNVSSIDDGLQAPSCLHLDESQGRLFVGEGADWQGCGQRRILVFDNVVNIANNFQ